MKRANITSFVPGDPRASEAGKKGKRLPINIQWRDKLQKALSDGETTALDATFSILMREAKGGNIMAIRELLDRSFGKAVQFTVAVEEQAQENPVLAQITAMRQAIENKHKIIEIKAESAK